MIVWLTLGAVALLVLTALLFVGPAPKKRVTTTLPARPSAPAPLAAPAPAAAPMASTADAAHATTEDTPRVALSVPAIARRSEKPAVVPRSEKVTVPVNLPASSPRPRSEPIDEPEDTVMASRESIRAAGGEESRPLKRVHQLPDDPDHHEVSDVDGTNPTMPFAMILVTAIGRTDAGRRRKNNEDSYLALDEDHVYAVADGMGGHAAGEVASAMAVDALARAFRSKNFGGTPDPKLPRRGDELVRAVESANREIFERAAKNRELRGMGTTLVVARFSPNKKAVYIAHVGDSRCYRIRDGVITQLTQDHTLGAALGLKGRVADQLIRAVGTERDVGIDLTGDSPSPGDHYVLCSDGLDKMLADEQMRDIVEKTPDLADACSKLIQAANDAGGSDNITVILIRVDSLMNQMARL